MYSKNPDVVYSEKACRIQKRGVPYGFFGEQFSENARRRPKDWAGPVVSDPGGAVHDAVLSEPAVPAVRAAGACLPVFLPADPGTGCPAWAVGLVRLADGSLGPALAADLQKRISVCYIPDHEEPVNSEGVLTRPGAIEDSRLAGTEALRGFCLLCFGENCPLVSKIMN